LSPTSIFVTAGYYTLSWVEINRPFGYSSAVQLQGILPLYTEAFLRLLFPSLCAVCSHLLELEERGLCNPCAAGLEKFRLLPSEERIRLSLSDADEGWALFRYEAVVKDLLHKIKFGRRRDLLHLFDEPLLHFFKRRFQLGQADCIIPVPLDPRRRLEREFNQSGLLAKKIHRITGLPVVPKGLAKRRSTPAQSLLGREARELNLKGAFRAADEGRIRGRSILLVDDVFTTGATVEEAARTLKRSGASRITYVALTRALGR